MSNLILNPSATVDLSNAAVSGGFTLSRDTSVFRSSPASFKVVTDGTGAAGKRLVLNSSTGLGLTGLARRFGGSIWVSGTATNQVRVDIVLIYTDASSLIVTGTTATLAGDTQFDLVTAPTVTADPAKTVNQVTISVRALTAAVFDFYAEDAFVDVLATTSRYSFFQLRPMTGS